MPAALAQHRSNLKAMISEQIGNLIGTGTFDAVPALARHLPLNAVTALVGLGESERAKCSTGHLRSSTFWDQFLKARLCRQRSRLTSSRSRN